MNQGRTVFSQLISFLPDREFRRCVERYQGDLRLRGLTCWDQYLAMAFAQLTYRESLRDIEACLGSLQGKLYHLGFRGKVARSTLADANESRDWRIFADFAQRLIATARRLYAREPMGVDLEQSLYALDSTTIDLCLALFPWARFRRRKAAVKMHTLLDLRGNIPTFVRITDGKVHDVNGLVGAHAGALVHRTGVAPLEQQVRLGAHHEEGRAERQHEEPLEVDVAAIHHVERAHLRHDLVEDVRVKLLFVGTAENTAIGTLNAVPCARVGGVSAASVDGAPHHIAGGPRPVHHAAPVGRVGLNLNVIQTE